MVLFYSTGLFIGKIQIVHYYEDMGWKKVPELDEELKDKETENLQDIDNAGEAGKEDELLSERGN